MNSLTHWNPFRELEEMQSRLSHYLGRTPKQRGENEALSFADWAPLVDIAEDEKEYLINAELPDVPKDQIHVTVENGTLLISGERKFEKEEKTLKYHRLERSYGSFERSFGLPEDADPTNVVAEFKDGVLHVHIAKGIETKPKAIEVKVA